MHYYIMEKEPTYILMQCDMGSEMAIIEAIAKMPGVAEVRGTYGTFDIFCRVVATPAETENIVEQVRRTPHIHSTTTLRTILSQGGK